MRDQAKQVLARNVKRAIIEKGITPAELARRAGLTRDNISTYMRASSLPSEDSLKRLAKALG
jgi:transcriptional regulator with XRE-family HTH domain